MVHLCLAELILGDRKEMLICMEILVDGLIGHVLFCATSGTIDLPRKRQIFRLQRRAKSTPHCS